MASRDLRARGDLVDSRAVEAPKATVARQGGSGQMGRQETLVLADRRALMGHRALPGLQLKKVSLVRPETQVLRALQAPPAAPGSGVQQVRRIVRRVSAMSKGRSAVAKVPHANAILIRCL